jgi:hypothetical protein
MRDFRILKNVVAEAGVASQDIPVNVPSWALYAIVYLNITASAGTTPLFDMKFQWVDPVDKTTKEDFPGAGITQVAGNDFVIFMLGAPGLADDDTGPVYSTALPLPPLFNINLIENTGDETYTYTLSISFVG